jgi:hypothetical protein
MMIKIDSNDMAFAVFCISVAATAITLIICWASVEKAKLKSNVGEQSDG